MKIDCQLLKGNTYAVTTTYFEEGRMLYIKEEEAHVLHHESHVS